MIVVTKEEYFKLKSKFPDISMSRTMHGHQGKHRGKRYIPEEVKYLVLIQDTNVEARNLLDKRRKRNEK